MWREEHAKFINSQYNNAYRVIEILKKTPEGKAKLRKIYGINNRNYDEFY